MRAFGLNVGPSFSTRRLLLAAMVSVGALLGLSGCGKNSPANTDGQVRMINLAPEAGAINVVIDSATTPLLSSVAFKSTSGYGTVANGGRRVRISNAGGFIIDGSLNMQGQKKQLLMVFGGQSSLGMGVLYNDIGAAAQGNSRLRLISYGVGLSNFDLYMTLANESIATSDPKARNTNGTVVDVSANSYTISLTAPGTKDVLFSMPSTALADRKYYNLVLYNEGSGELPNAFFLEQDSDAAPTMLTSPITRVRGVNAQSTFPTVNVAVGGNRVFTNIPLGGISSFTRTAAGTASVSFTDPQTGNTVGSVSDTYLGGRDYSVFLAPGTGGGAPSAFRVLDTNFPPAAGRSRVRLVNASSVADLGLALSFTPITPNIGSRAASNYFEVVAGTGTPVTITQGAAGTPVISLSGTDLIATKTFTFVVSGTPGNLVLTVRQDN
ncbi:MAG: DUF4397 domain-containing protein [Burkholderiales bacterium]